MIGSVVAVVLTLAVAGSVYESWATRRSNHLHPPLGKLFSVGSHCLHLHCIGEGKNTVIFDSGAGGSSLDWYDVQKELGEVARVCTYDRAGFGWSGLGPVPRTSGRIVEELRTLLGKADIRPPYILVGHSFGGLTMQLFAATYPKEVIGLVLVDSVHSEHYSKMPVELRKVVSSQLSWLRVAGWLGPLGVPRMLFPPVATQGLSRDIQPMANSRGYGKNVYTTLYEEAKAFETSCGQLRSAGPLRNDLLLTVLSRSNHEQWPTTVCAESAEDSWQNLQAELAKTIPESKHIVVEHAGHFIHLDQPQVVLDAIKAQIDAAQK